VAGTELLTIRDAAAVLGLTSRNQVYRAIENGFLDEVLVNGVRHVRREGLHEAWAKVPKTKSKHGSRKAPVEAAQKPLRPAKERMAVRSDAAESEKRPADADGDTPDFNTERAWTEYEKKLKLQVERELLEGKLVYREDVEQAQKAVALTLQDQALSLPQQIKNQIPHLTVEEQDIVTKLVNQFLQNVADWEFTEGEVAG
jgi:phage terminase Nu1 subunit (DNA packaging protein)